MRGFVAVAGLTARRPLPKAFRTVVVVVVVVNGDGDGDAPSHHCYPDPVPAPLAARLPSRALLSLALTLAACGHDATPTDQAVFDLGTPDLGPIPDDAGLDASLPGLSAPDLLRLPYVDANAGSVSATLDVTTSGTVPLSLTFELTGDPLLTLESTPPDVFRRVLEVNTVGPYLGTRAVLTEIVAFQQLHDLRGVISDRSIAIATFAVCGFANFASIGIQIGGLGALVPERKSDIARLGLLALVTASLANFSTACVAGALL